MNTAMHRAIRSYNSRKQHPERMREVGVLLCLMSAASVIAGVYWAVRAIWT